MSEKDMKTTAATQDAAGPEAAEVEETAEQAAERAAEEAEEKAAAEAEEARAHWLHTVRDNKIFRNVYTAVCVIISAFIQAFVIQTFIRPAELLSSGFTGIALLVEFLGQKLGFYFPAQIGMLCINIPVGLFCAKGISKRFSIFSFLNVFLTSFFLQVCSFGPIFDEPMLDVIFGGVVGGLGSVIALRANASCGGTDFIALYVSNKTGRSIWNQVFLGNCVLYLIFGYLFGWMNAAYSVLYSFVATKTVSTFHHRYDRVTLQITTEKPKEIIGAYTANFVHGISCATVVGGYSGKEMYLLHTVLSSYEEQEAIRIIRRTDPHVIINVMKTVEFYGKYVNPTIE